METEWKLTTDESVGETENLLEQALKQNKNLGQGLQSKLFYVACSCLASNSCKDYKDWFQQELSCTCLSWISAGDQ